MDMYAIRISCKRSACVPQLDRQRYYLKSDDIDLLAVEATDTPSSSSLPAFFLCLALSGTINLIACTFGVGRQKNDGIWRGVSIEERRPPYASGVVTREVMGDPKRPSVRTGVRYVGTACM
jgi:hypothetical protein